MSRRPVDFWTLVETDQMKPINDTAHPRDLEPHFTENWDNDNAYSQRRNK